MNILEVSTDDLLKEVHERLSVRNGVDDGPPQVRAYNKMTMRYVGEARKSLAMMEKEISLVQVHQQLTAVPSGKTEPVAIPEAVPA